jgi:hypothetical protein
VDLDPRRATGRGRASLSAVDRMEEKMSLRIEIPRNKPGASGILRSGILNVWNRPIIICGVLLIPAVFLLILIIKGAFTKYTNCSYLVITQLGMDPIFCNGVDVKVLGTSIFTIAGMKNVMDPPLELIRSGLAWSVVLLIAFISLFLTILLVNLKSVVRLITFNKDEWNKIFAGTRVWLFLFVGICSIFYFVVVR